ncbi:MAG TPA: terpene synthase family protein [Polyangiaceae bacterium]|nr:terpene synthase family protein [Polyangiaceae bacterium]
MFASACAPPWASARYLDLSARLLLLFLATDDADAGDLVEPPADRPWAIGRFAPSLARWADEFTELSAAPGDRARFVDAFHGYVRARKAEAAPGAQALTPEEHARLRRQTIFLDPLVIAGCVASGLDLGRLGRHVGACCDDAAHAIWLANDLGSYDRDRAEGEAGDLNIIAADLRASGGPEARAFDRVVERYNGLVRALRARFEALAGDPAAGADGARFAELLGAIVDGNLVAMGALGSRYSRLDALRGRLASALGPASAAPLAQSAAAASAVESEAEPK